MLSKSQYLQELLLLELDSEASVLNLLTNCSHNNNVKVIPTASPFLWLRAIPADEGIASSASSPAISSVITEDSLANDNLEELLSNAQSVSIVSSKYYQRSLCLMDDYLSIT